MAARHWCDNPRCIHRGHDVIEGTNNVVVDRDDLAECLSWAEDDGPGFGGMEWYARIKRAVEA